VEAERKKRSQETKSHISITSDDVELVVTIVEEQVAEA